MDPAKFEDLEVNATVQKTRTERRNGTVTEVVLEASARAGGDLEQYKEDPLRRGPRFSRQYDVRFTVSGGEARLLDIKERDTDGECYAGLAPSDFIIAAVCEERVVQIPGVEHVRSVSQCLEEALNAGNRTVMSEEVDLA